MLCTLGSFFLSESEIEIFLSSWFSDPYVIVQFVAWAQVLVLLVHLISIISGRLHMICSS